MHVSKRSAALLTLGAILGVMLPTGCTTVVSAPSGTSVNTVTAVSASSSTSACACPFRVVS